MNKQDEVRIKIEIVGEGMYLAKRRKEAHFFLCGLERHG
jgi:hypothetical protein